MKYLPIYVCVQNITIIIGIDELIIIKIPEDNITNVVALQVAHFMLKLYYRVEANKLLKNDKTKNLYKRNFEINEHDSNEVMQTENRTLSV